MPPTHSRALFTSPLFVLFLFRLFLTTATLNLSTERSCAAKCSSLRLWDFMNFRCVSVNEALLGTERRHYCIDDVKANRKLEKQLKARQSFR
jgi:hypothetical protein